MCLYWWICLNMPAYTWINRVLNIPRLWMCLMQYKLLSCYQGLSVQCKIFKMECFTKRVMPEWRRASRYFSRQWRFCGTRKIWQTLQQKTRKKGRNIWEFFLLDTLIYTFWMKDIPQRWTQSGPSSQESGYFSHFQQSSLPL